MSVTYNESEKPGSASTLKTAIGWVLIGAAFLLMLGVALKAGGAFEAGQKTGRLLAAWLLLFLVGWALTFKRSQDAKANARIVIGIVLLLASVVASLPVGIMDGFGNSARDKEIGKKFLSDAIALSKKHEQRFLELGERMAKADMSTILAPQNVTNKAGLAKSRAMVAQYRGFIAERGAILKLNLKEGKELVKSLPPGDVRDGAQKGVEGKLKETTNFFKDVDRAERAQFAHVEKILDWCEAQGSKLRRNGSEFVFTSEAQRSEFSAMVEQLEKLELEVGDASKAMQHKAERTEKNNAESIKKAKKIFEE